MVQLGEKILNAFKSTSVKCVKDFLESRNLVVCTNSGFYRPKLSKAVQKCLKLSKLLWKEGKELVEISEIKDFSFRS